jgi:GrpB-like predicted nucleotidyltransferase (UPF0157 family)
MPRRPSWSPRSPPEAYEFCNRKLSNGGLSVASIAGVAGDISDGLRERLRAMDLDPLSMFTLGPGPWELWLLLRDRWGRQATLVDLYELEAASRGVRLECLSAADRSRLRAAARPVCYPGRQPALPGSDRLGDPHEISEYDPAWLVTFADWRSRLAAALGGAATRIDHVGSTAVPGLAAKPVIDIMISVPDTRDEHFFLPACLSTGLILRMREEGHLLLWPPPANPREVHVHVCDSASDWDRDELLFRDYLVADSAVRNKYSALKRGLIARWHDDRRAYTEAKTAFVLDTLEHARMWAVDSGWNP